MLIGFDFAEPFWKYMFGVEYNQYETEDWKHIWDEDTLKSYLDSTAVLFKMNSK